MTAKRLISQNWECADSLDGEQWLRSFLDMLVMEKTITNLAGPYNEELSEWSDLF